MADEGNPELLMNLHEALGTVAKVDGDFSLLPFV
jgi:hypothetical protein